MSEKVAGDVDRLYYHCKYCGGKEFDVIATLNAARTQVVSFALFSPLESFITCHDCGKKVLA